RAQPLEPAVDLGTHPPEGLVGVALLLGLADAQDRLEPVLERRLELEVARGVELAEVLPPLRVADDDVRAADVLEQPGRDLAGPGALVFPEAVLRRQPDRRALEALGHRVQRGE